MVVCSNFMNNLFLCKLTALINSQKTNIWNILVKSIKYLVVGGYISRCIYPSTTSFPLKFFPINCFNSWHLMESFVFLRCSCFSGLRLFNWQVESTSLLWDVTQLWRVGVDVSTNWWSLRSKLPLQWHSSASDWHLPFFLIKKNATK